MSILATVDFKNLFNDRPIRITQQDRKKIDKFPKEAKTRIREFFDRKRQKPLKPNQFPISDFNKFKDIITQDNSVSVLAEKFAALQDDELKDEVVAQITNAVTNLTQILPVNQSETLLGIDDRPPSDREKFKFMQSIRVLENPFSIFDLLDQGILTHVDTDALALFYPEFYDNFKQWTLEEIVDRKANGEQQSDLTRNQKYQLSVLLGVPRLNPKTFKRLQETYLKEEEQQNPDIKTSRAPDIAENTSTSTSNLQK